MIDRIIGVLAIAALLGFLGVLVGFVPSLDLAIVILVVAAMAAFDFYRTLFRSGNGKR